MKRSERNIFATVLLCSLKELNFENEDGLNYIECVKIERNQNQPLTR